jgi:hypothetical protein
MATMCLGFFVQNKKQLKVPKQFRYSQKSKSTFQFTNWSDSAHIFVANIINCHKYAKAGNILLNYVSDHLFKVLYNLCNSCARIGAITPIGVSFIGSNKD